MKIFQSSTTEDPVLPKEIVNKRYVDALSTATSPIFFIDAIPTPSSGGIIGNKVYLPGTVPSNAVITEATTDNDAVRVRLLAEGPATFYSPTIQITGSPALPGEPINVPLTEDSNDKRLFYGELDLSISINTTLTATSSNGAQAEIIINRAAAGPLISSLTIGALPIGVNSGLQQTEVKAGDVVPITGTVENTATGVSLLGGGAAASSSVLTLGAANSGGSGFKTFNGSFVVSNLSGSQTVSAVAVNSFGTEGDEFISTNSITLNQTFPIIGTITFDYPVGQQAIKNSETATVNSIVSDFDLIEYTSSTDLSVANTTTYESAKIVTRIGGDYVYGVNNYTITAIKASNDALTAASGAVTIANVAPTASLSIDSSPARLRSSSSGQNYSVRLDPNQFLLQAPDALVADEGIFSGSWTSSTGDTWVKTITINDTHAKGTHTFNSMIITGLAGVQGTVITAGNTYEIGGFTSRILTYAAFQQASDIGTFVADASKLVASYQNSSSLTFVSNLNDQTQAFSVADRINDDVNALYDPTNRYLWINDVAFAGSNTTGTLTVVVEELA